MAEKPDPDDQEIRRLLAGSEKEIREAVAWISDLYTGPMCGSMRHKFRWFPAEDLADAWQTVLLLVLERALARDLDTTKPIYPLLWTILKRRCCDILNQDARCRKALEALSQELPAAASPEGSGLEHCAELSHLVDKAILRLSPVRRLIWEAYRDLGFCATDEKLLEVLSQTAPSRHWTPASVRRGKQEGRKKLRKTLQKRGDVWSVPTNPSSRMA